MNNEEARKSFREMWITYLRLGRCLIGSYRQMQDASQGGLMWGNPLPE
jgi:hypothetical protein